MLLRLSPLPVGRESCALPLFLFGQTIFCHRSPQQRQHPRHASPALLKVRAVLALCLQLLYRVWLVVCKLAGGRVPTKSHAS